MQGHASEHVCVVDDEPKVRAVLRKTLERAGFTVSCFASADDCLTYLDSGKCDLLVTDVRMPEGDGIELVAKVRKILPWLPVLVVTGFGDVPMAVKAFKMGAADFIEKPLDRDTFLAAVQTLLARDPVLKVLRDQTLTRMELKVLYQILKGKNNREIADVLSRSHRTVEVHRRHLMQKLKASNVVELLRQAAKLHLSELDVPAVGSQDAAENRE
ncbi:MAG: response regulator transcription factor [Sedimentisphaerales bacterium]|nr:response regulator transcription factor [Sedimentisphaerales bacterium]